MIVKYNVLQLSNLVICYGNCCSYHLFRNVHSQIRRMLGFEDNMLDKPNKTGFAKSKIWIVPVEFDLDPTF